MVCAACHHTEFTVIPGVSRWVDVVACVNCGTLRVKTEKAENETKQGES